MRILVNRAGSAVSSSEVGSDKTHQDGEGLDLVHLHDRPQPVCRLRDQLTTRARSDGPQARPAAAIGERVQVLAAKAGVTTTAKVTSQGVRAGAATDLTRPGRAGRL